MRKIDISKQQLLPKGSYKPGGPIPDEGIVYSDLNERLVNMRDNDRIIFPQPQLNKTNQNQGSVDNR